jgi:hypothetical protein
MYLTYAEQNATFQSLGRPAVRSDAAERFNRFFGELVRTIADARAAPTRNAGNSFGR